MPHCLLIKRKFSRQIRLKTRNTPIIFTYKISHCIYVMYNAEQNMRCTMHGSSKISLYQIQTYQMLMVTIVSTKGKALCRYRHLIETLCSLKLRTSSILNYIFSKQKPDTSTHNKENYKRLQSTSLAVKTETLNASTEKKRQKWCFVYIAAVTAYTFIFVKCVHIVISTNERRNEYLYALNRFSSAIAKCETTYSYTHRADRLRLEE